MLWKIFRQKEDLEMKDVVSKLVSHPIATVIVIGSIADSATRVIAAMKGKEIQPVININLTMPNKTK